MRRALRPRAERQRSSRSPAAPRPAALRRRASIEHRDPIGDAAHLLEIVRHHQDGRPAARFSARAGSPRAAAPPPRRGRWPARRAGAAPAPDRARCASSTRRSSPPESTASGRRSRPGEADPRRAARATRAPRRAAARRGRPAAAGAVSARKSSTVTGSVRIDREALRHVADPAGRRASCSDDAARRRRSGRASPPAACSCPRRSGRRCTWMRRAPTRERHAVEQRLAVATDRELVDLEERRLAGVRLMLR